LDSRRTIAYSSRARGGDTPANARLTYGERIRPRPGLDPTPMKVRRGSARIVT
jgi:hypothetical protein